MPRKRNWKQAEVKRGALNPKKKKLTDLTGDTGPGDTSCIPTNSTIVDHDCQTELAGDTVLLNNSTRKNCQKTCQKNCQRTCQRNRQRTFQRDCRLDLQVNHCNNSLQVKEDSQLDSHSDSFQVPSDYFNDSQRTENAELYTQKTYYPFNAFFLKFGTFDQFDSRFEDQSRGNQCTCNSLVFLAMSCARNDPESVDPDIVLTSGDKLYTKTIAELKNIGKYSDMLLNFNEIPTLLEVAEGNFQVCKKDLVIGVAIQTSDSLPSLQESLFESLQHSNSVLIMIGKICSALLHCKNYYFFDSHSHGGSGLADEFEGGRSIIIAFTEIDDLVNYLYAMYTSMFISLQEQFEILPVSFLNMNTAKVLERQIKSYFDYQEQMKPTEENQTDQSDNSQARKKSRSLYHQLYKQNQRKNLLFRSNERKKEKESKRKARIDRDFKNKEANGKRSKRQDPVYRGTERDKELLSKQTARQDQDFKNKEADDKRSKRQDPVYRGTERDKELLSKQTARQDQDFKNKEADDKRSKRQDPVYRGTERDKELLSKQTARQDPVFRATERDKELLSKQTARQDPVFRATERDKELISKQTARQDPVFRATEKDRELLSKQTARQDPIFRATERDRELLSKQTARQDPLFLQNESKKDQQRKHQSRLNPDILEKERLAKQNSRRENRIKHQNYNRNIKQNKRQNKQFVAHESLLKKQNRLGSDFSTCIRKFEEKMSIGPVYICSCCHQTWFSDSVVNAKTIKSSCTSTVSFCFTNLRSVDDIEWICHTCLNAIRSNKIPRLSLANKMGFPEKPRELELYPLEERLISLRIPFMQIRQLPRGGQLSVKGNVVNVPVDVQPTINSLPRNMDQSGTIAVKLKKKLSFKSCDFSENVRPLAVICALHYLMKRSELYKSSGIQIDEKWVDEIGNQIPNGTGCTEDDETFIEAEKIVNSNLIKSGNENDIDGYDSDHFSEVDERDLHTGNTDTLLDEILEESDPKQDLQYIFAPGEGQRPLSLYYDEDAEYLSFPSIFCGQRRPDIKERSVKVHYTDIVKWELRAVDRRVANSVPNIFFKLKKIQLKNISDKVHLALRRCKSNGKQWTAKDILNPSTVNQLVRLDEGYYIFRTLRNSPVYLEKKKKDLFAMIRQLGLPKWFGSFSSADTRWNELLRVLGKLNDGKEYTDSDLENMSWHDKTRLVQKDPVTCSRFFDYRVQQFIKIVLKSEHNPIGKITDFFYRVEFQQRGSPHIHILIWVEKAPMYKVDTNQDIVEYIDKYVSCANIPELKDLIDLQVHKHAKTCRKKGHPICRFGFPLPPFRKTVILEPLETDIDRYKLLYKEVQKKIDSLLDLENIEHMTFDQFLTEELEMSEEEYVKVIRSNLNGPKVFLQRKPCEVRINPYMKIVLSAWKANHDLQFVLDPYACAMYIVSYISKSQKGMSALLDQAAKEARQGNLDLKRQVRHIGNYFTNSVETCAQEAIYLLLQLPLTKATRQVVFINTSPSEKRTFLLKTTPNLEKLSPDSTDIEAENDIKRYSKRPQTLENWCLADYISQLEVTFPKKQSSDNVEENEEESENEVEHDEPDSLIDNDSVKINIELKNGVTIKQRKSYRVIRYVRFNKKNDSENYYRERLMLFWPWRNETNLKGKHESYEKMYKTVSRHVEKIAKQYEHNAEELDRAQEQAENDCNQYDELAPGTQQTELEDIEQGATDADQYVHFNPDRPANQRSYDISEELGMPAPAVELSAHAKRVNDNDYFELIRCLNIKQREFFLHVLTWIKTKQEPLYAFLTGGAGVGKSVVVKAIFQSLHRYLCSAEGEDPDNIRILLCAPTGKAAYNINGVTIHNAFQIQPSKGFNQSLSCDVLNTLRAKYRNLSVIMIDEISMVGNRMFSLLDTRLKKIKGNNQHFGGVSLIAIGDFFQLKPVFDGWIFEDQSKGISALAPNLWKHLFKVFELTDIMRQKDDIEFAHLLNRLRVNELTENDIAILNTRVISTTDPNYPSTTTHLFRENALVDNFNLQYISQLTSEKVKVSSVDTISADVSENIKKKLINSLPKNQSDTANLANIVELAVGMKYDLTANINVDDGLTNGSSCEVKLLEYRTNTPRPSIVWVRFTDDTRIGSDTRKKYRHLYNENVDKSWTPIFDIKRSFVYRFKTFDRIQFPLRPSAGKTIHKSQGDTLDTVVVNLNSKTKATVPHIHYVALSRVRTLSGLYIVDMNLSKMSVSNNVREELKRLRSDNTLQLCFTPLYNINDTLFKFAFNNTRSLHAHIEDIKSDPNILSADVIGLAETRLITDDSYEEYDLKDYNFFRTDQEQTDRRTRPPHGLALYVRNTLSVEDIRDFSCPDFEFVVADIVGTKGHIQVVVIYKSPKCNFQHFKDLCLNELLPCLSAEQSNLIMMGDFNFDIQKTNSSFLAFMEQTFLCNQIVSKVTTDYNTTLDLVFMKVDSTVPVSSGVIEAYWSDHNIVYAAADLTQCFC